MSQNLDYKLYILFNALGGPKTITTFKEVVDLDQEEGDFVIELNGEVPKALLDQLIRARIKVYENRIADLEARKPFRNASESVIEERVKYFQTLIEEHLTLLQADDYVIEDLLCISEIIDD